MRKTSLARERLFSRHARWGSAGVADHFAEAFERWSRIYAPAFAFPPHPVPIAGNASNHPYVREFGRGQAAEVRAALLHTASASQLLTDAARHVCLVARGYGGGCAAEKAFVRRVAAPVVLNPKSYAPVWWQGRVEFLHGDVIQRLCVLSLLHAHLSFDRAMMRVPANAL